MRFTRFDQRNYDLRAVPKNVRTSVLFMRFCVLVFLGLFFTSIVINVLSQFTNTITIDNTAIPFLTATGVAIFVWFLTLLRDRLAFQGGTVSTRPYTLAKLIVDDIGGDYYSCTSQRMAAHWKQGNAKLRSVWWLPRLFYYLYTTLLIGYFFYFWFVIDQLSGGDLPNLPNWLYLTSALALIVLYVLFFAGMLIPRPQPSAKTD